MGIDWIHQVVKVKRRALSGQRQVGLVKCAHRPDVLPIPFEDVAENPVGLDRCRKDIPAKVIVIGFDQ